MVATSATRAAPRRQMTLPFRFARDGQFRSAVSVNVSATGMYLSASHVPSAGELVRLTLIPKRGAIRADIFGEVRWGHGAPSLDHPEPGFGLHFIEISCLEEESEGLVRLLESFGLEQARQLIQLETRDNTRLALSRFT